MAKLEYLLSLTPRESWRILRHRLPGLRGGPSWLPHELIYSSKHGRGIRFAELLLRQEAVVRRAMPWEPLNFDGRRVVEIGCGPLGGFGPLAIFLRRGRVRERRAGMGSELVRKPRSGREISFYLLCRSGGAVWEAHGLRRVSQAFARAHAISSAAASKNSRRTARPTS